MLLKIKNNLSNIENRIPSSLRNSDVLRIRRRNEKNFSLKIEKLYGAGADVPIYLGLENGNILGSESGVGLGIENQRM